ncbi:MAG: isoprenylcysteine carboxylmethyltransferase family protein, partial [Anaerolineales bacterium]
LFRGSYNLVDLGMSDIQVLIFDAFLCLLFFTQHSLMARKRFRQWLARFLPMQYSGAFYAVASGIAVLLLVVFWQETASTLVSPQGPIRLFLRVIFVLAIVGVGWTIWALGLFVNFRLEPMVDDLRDKQSESRLVTDRGPYRWIRHPLYLSSLLMIWSYPDLTLDRLLFNLLFSIWVIVAIILEERGLVATFGEAYRNYQREVPILIPWRILPDILIDKSSIGKGVS